MTYPYSAEMALRSTQNTPNRMRIVIKVPGGKEVAYDVPVLKEVIEAISAKYDKVQEGISSEDIVKELLKRFSDTSNT